MNNRKPEKSIPTHAISFSFSIATAAFAAAQYTWSETGSSAGITFACSTLLFVKGVYDLHQENRLKQVASDVTKTVNLYTGSIWTQPPSSQFARRTDGLNTLKPGL